MVRKTPVVHQEVVERAPAPVVDRGEPSWASCSLTVERYSPEE